MDGHDHDHGDHAPELARSHAGTLSLSWSQHGDRRSVILRFLFLTEFERHAPLRSSDDPIEILGNMHDSVTRMVGDLPNNIMSPKAYVAATGMAVNVGKQVVTKSITTGADTIADISQLGVDMASSAVKDIVGAAGSVRNLLSFDMERRGEFAKDMCVHWSGSNTNCVTAGLRSESACLRTGRLSDARRRHATGTCAASVTASRSCRCPAAHCPWHVCLVSVAPTTWDTLLKSCGGATAGPRRVHGIDAILPTVHRF